MVKEIREQAFQKNQSLESLLAEVNNDLWPVEDKLLTGISSQLPPIFIVGSLRSGTTLTLQWLASLGSIAYPSNMLSRFYRAPMMGAKLQLLLTDEQYNFRNELSDFKDGFDFKSENGKTQGMLSPNEFWYFWRRFLPFKGIDYIPTDELIKLSDSKLLVSELKGVMHVFQKPFAMKAMILNYNIDYLDKLFKNAIFVYVKRDPLTNISSILDARLRQLGDISSWYSFKNPEYYQLSKLTPHEQAAGQVYYINKAIQKGLISIPEHRKIVVQYEKFCQNPSSTFELLVDALQYQGVHIRDVYQSTPRFKISNRNISDSKIIDAYHKFYS